MRESATQVHYASLNAFLLPQKPRWAASSENVFTDARREGSSQKQSFCCALVFASSFAAVVRAVSLMAAVIFDTLIDDSLAKITTTSQLKHLLNKRVLSFVNDFEDGKWQYNRFQNYLWDNIAQTALSERERSALVNQSHSSLVAAAQNLRLTDKDEVGQGSEIAEVFLYGVMRNHYKALPVVPKIFYKQNVQDNAKGADSVHIVLDAGQSDFTLWFGEAKFYSSIADARLDAVVTSVYASLNTGKLKKENAIITNVSDIDHLAMPDRLRSKIKSALRLQTRS